MTKSGNDKNRKKTEQVDGADADEKDLETKLEQKRSGERTYEHHKFPTFFVTPEALI